MELNLMIDKSVFLDGVFAGSLKKIEADENELKLTVKINQDEFDILKEYACINAVIEREND